MLRFAGSLFVIAIPLAAQPRYFVTALGGISALSADAATQPGAPNRVALYSPKNGGALNVAAGVHLNSWLSAQGNYVWNRNSLTLTQVSDGASFEQDRSSRQHSGVLDLLLYFRNRQSWARPYLSTGFGFVRVSDTTGAVRGELTAPAAVDVTRPLLRVAVGIDLMHPSGWGFRYSFSESISGNPYSAIMVPQGSRNLANFQNLFGFVRYF